MPTQSSHRQMKGVGQFGGGRTRQISDGRTEHASRSHVVHSVTREPSRGRPAVAAAGVPMCRWGRRRCTLYGGWVGGVLLSNLQYGLRGIPTPVCPPPPPLICSRRRRRRALQMSPRPPQPTAHATSPSRPPSPPRAPVNACTEDRVNACALAQPCQSTSFSSLAIRVIRMQSASPPRNSPHELAARMQSACLLTSTARAANFCFSASTCSAHNAARS